MLTHVAVFFFILFILYLFAIMPQLKKPDSLKSLTKQHYYAHRGLHDNNSDAPENSLLAISRAVTAGYGIELDVQLSKDGIPVVFHDYNLERVCGVNKKISSLTLVELQRLKLFSSNETIPTLAQVLAVVNAAVPLIIEYKLERNRYDVCVASNQLLTTYAGPYCIESFNPFVVLWYRKNRPDIVRGQLSSDFYREGNSSPALFLVKHLLLNFITKPDFVAYNCVDKHSLSRNICHRLYKNIAIAWTIHSPKELDENRFDFDCFIFEGFYP